MKKTGLEELEALNLDWNPGYYLLTFSVLVECADGDVFSSEERPKYFNPNKKIQDALDPISPFAIQYNYGYLR